MDMDIVVIAIFMGVDIGLFFIVIDLLVKTRAGVRWADQKVAQAGSLKALKELEEPYIRLHQAYVGYQFILVVLIIAAVCSCLYIGYRF